MTLRLQQRDQAVLAELYDGYSGRALGLASRVLGATPAAEDVVHDAFLWSWEHADRIDLSRGSPEALLMTVVRRRAIDVLRRRTRLAAAPDIWRAADDDALDILSNLDQAEAVKRVRVAVGQLETRQREAVELAFFGGLTHREIAEKRGVPLGTVKSRLRLAMGRLRSALREEAD